MSITADRHGGVRTTGRSGAGESAEARRCHCGEPLQPCGDCPDLRCFECDPYRSDDCRSDR